ncbi:hypothetical protein [Lonepinella sp. MS14437]
MKKIILFILMASFLSACTVGGGFGASNGGAGVAVGTGIGF